MVELHKLFVNDATLRANHFAGFIFDSNILFASPRSYRGRSSILLAKCLTRDSVLGADWTGGPPTLITYPDKLLKTGKYAHTVNVALLSDSADSNKNDIHNNKY